MSNRAKVTGLRLAVVNVKSLIALFVATIRTWKKVLAPNPV